MSADFTPTMGTYTELKPFRYWCQKVLPLVYDDTLSYYELLCKVVDYLNKTMEDVDTLHGDVEALHAAYEELQGYVNDYFTNLDVQEEINNKLDQMALDGTLAVILRPIITDEVAAWLAAHLTPTTPVVDDTLTIEGAAADAEKTGDEIKRVENGWVDGYILGLFGASLTIDTANNSLVLSAPSGSFCRLYYGINKYVDISGTITKEIDFTSLPNLYYDLTNSTIVAIGAGATVPAPKQNYVYLGFAFHNDRTKINFFPSYTVDGNTYTTKDTKDIDYFRANNIGFIEAWLNAYVSVDTVAGNITINPNGGFCRLFYGANKFVTISSTISISITSSALPNIYYDLANNTLVAIGAGNNIPAPTDNYIFLGYVWNDFAKLEVYPLYTVNGRVITNNSANVRRVAKTRIAFVGDSLTTFAGISPNINGGGYYPTTEVNTKEKCYEYIAANQNHSNVACLQAISQATIKYQQIGGQDCYGYSDTWVNNVVASNPDAIVINLGINDVFSAGITGQLSDVQLYADAPAGMTDTTYGSFQYTLLKYIHACPNAKIIVCIPSLTIYTNVTDAAEKFNKVCQMLEDCAKLYGCYIVDFRQCGITYENISTYKYDGIHPNALGMKKLGDYLSERLLTILN